MSKKSPAGDRIVLKILSGTQSGAEVALDPGDYTLGAGADDDIQLIDISLTAGHARLRLSATKIEIQGGNGSLVSSSGTEIPALGDTWSELEPLEIVTAGTTRFALGPVHANWTSLSEAALAPKVRTKTEARADTGWRQRIQQVNGYTNIGIMVVLALILIAVVYQQWTVGGLAPRSASQGSLASLREALAAQPYASSVSVREDVDGTIYATGFVETAVDRRAVAAVAEKLSIPLRMRLNVRQTMRGEIDTMIASMKVPVTAALAPDGVVRLDGVVLKDDVVNQFIERLKTDVSGISQIDNHIRTARSLIGEIEKLAKKAQIESYVVFRLDNQSVEVNGILPVEKIDAWVGFIQAYSKNFAKDIALRSYVQLQSAGTDAPTPAPTPGGPAISIGPHDSNSADIALDMDRIRRGLYELSDLFVGMKRKPAAGSDTAAVPAAATPPAVQTPAADTATATTSRDDWQLATPDPATKTVNPTPSANTLNAAKPDVPASAAASVFGTQAYAGEAPKPADRLVAQISGAAGGTAPGAEKVASVVAAISPEVKQLEARSSTATGTDRGTGQSSAPAGNIAPGSATAIPATAAPATAPLTTVAPATVTPATALPAAKSPADAAIEAAVPLSASTATPKTDDKPLPRPATLAQTSTQPLTEAANKLISRWLLGLSGQASLPPAVQATLNRIAETRASSDPKDDAESDSKPRYLPLMTTDLPDGATQNTCWPGSRLTTANLPTALFWLDVLSLSQQLSLKTFTMEEQRFLLEAASNPQRVRSCIADKGSSGSVALTSLYLNEAIRNPDFIRFVVRDLVATDIDIAGINLAGERFAQTRDGVKHREGTTLDIGRRLISVGELASIIRSNEGYVVVPYGSELNWKLTSR